MVEKVLHSTRPGLHRCGSGWQAPDLGLAVRLNSGARVVALQMTRRFRGAQLNLPFDLASTMNGRGFVALITDMKVQEQIAVELSRVTGLNVRLLTPNEGRKVLTDAKLARFRQALKLNKISSFATQSSANPDMVACRLYGTLLEDGRAGGLIYFKGATPTKVTPEEFGLLLVVT